MKLATLAVVFTVVTGLAIAAAPTSGSSGEVMFETRQGSQPDKCFYCDNYYQSCLKEGLHDCRKVVCDKRRKQCQRCGYCSSSSAESDQVDATR